MNKYLSLAFFILIVSTASTQNIENINWEQEEVDFNKIIPSADITGWKILMSQTTDNAFEKEVPVAFPNYYGDTKHDTAAIYFESDTNDFSPIYLMRPIGISNQCTACFWHIIYRKESYTKRISTYRDLPILLGQIDSPQDAFLMAVVQPTLVDLLHLPTFQYSVSDKGFYIKLVEDESEEFSNLVIIEVTKEGKVTILQDHEKYDERFYEALSQPNFLNIQPAIPLFSWKMFGTAQRKTATLRYFIPSQYFPEYDKSWLQVASDQSDYETDTLVLPIGISTDFDTKGWFILYEKIDSGLGQVTTFEEMQEFLGKIDNIEEAILLISSYTWNSDRRILGELGSVLYEYKNGKYTLIFDKKTGDCPFRISQFKFELFQNGTIGDIAILEDKIISYDKCGRP
jgi:hypothetical protein